MPNEKVEIAVLQTEMRSVKEDISTIMTNHLPHLQSRLDSIERKLAYYAGGIVVILTIVNLVVGNK